MVLGPGEPQRSKQSLSLPLPAKCFQGTDSAMAPTWVFISSQIFFSIHRDFLQHARSSPGQRDSAVQQALVVHHCARDTAAGAGDTGKEKAKCLPLRSPKLAATSDNSAVRVRMEVATQTQGERRPNSGSLIQGWWWQTTLAESSIHPFLSSSQQPYEVLITPLYE